MGRLCVVVALVLVAAAAGAQGVAQVWATSYDGPDKLAAKDPIPLQPIEGEADIVVDGSAGHQTILGIGASFEHATCYNLSKLEPAVREDVIARIVDPEKGIGMNLMRICIGTSDFVGEPWYSYDDMPEGQADPNLERFSIEKDRAYVLPVLKSALAKNPGLLFFASPWSPPGWMKDSGQMCGGRLKPEFYEAYARYLVKAIQAYEAEGLPIHGMTLQNEPGVNQKTYPSCFWNGEMQRDFIKSSFGPIFKDSGLKTLVWCFDHNFNNLAFPRTILNDPAAAQYVDGTGFHHYAGRPEAMAQLLKEFPKKDVYFTEGSEFGLQGAAYIMKIFGNGARAYNAWVTFIDENGKPNNGPHDCSPTCIVYNTKTNQPEYRFDYYMYGHFSKFVQRGAVRLSDPPREPGFAHMAFKNPDGAIVLVVVNCTREPRPFRAVFANKQGFDAKLDARSMATYLVR